jgi:hypothetical protein
LGAQPPFELSREMLQSVLPACPPSPFGLQPWETNRLRAVFEQRGEFSAAVELRWRFPGITENAQARERLRPEHCAQAADGREVSPEVKVLFARVIRPRGET